jgi:hypothetical protein
VSLSDDGNTAIVGGFVDNSDAGAAWIWTRSGGVWTQQAKLVGTGAVGPAFQGHSVSVSGDGNTAMVGGSKDNAGAGAAWVYTRSGGVWTQQAKLVGTGALGSFGAEQGFSVSLSGDGNTAIVGGPGDDAAGAVWVYSRSGGVWSQQTKLIATGAVGNAEQGISASLSGDGNIAIVGGLHDNSDVGAAWVYTRSGGVWTQQAKLVGTGAVGPALQGISVALSSDGETGLVGGIGDNGVGAAGGVGAAWAYAQPGSNQAVFAGTPGKANCFGQSVSALVRQYHGLNGAAAAKGFSSVNELQNAISEFCGG